RPDAAPLPAPDVAGEPERSDGFDGRVAPRAREPADQRKAKPTVVDGQRARSEKRVQELPSSMRKTFEVASRGAVQEVELDLLDRQTRLERVNRHTQLATEAGGEWETGRPGALAQASLPGARL